MNQLLNLINIIGVITIITALYLLNKVGFYELSTLKPVAITLLVITGIYILIKREL